MPNGGSNRSCGKPLDPTDAAVKAGTFIRRIRNCPAELLAVNNELSDLRYVLAEVERLHDGAEAPRESNLGRTLERSQQLVAEILGVIQKIEGNDGGRFSVIDRVKWSVVQKEKVAGLISRLREVRFQFDTLIAASTARAVRRVTLVVEELRLVSTPTPTRISKSDVDEPADASSLSADDKMDLEKGPDQELLTLTKATPSFSTEKDGAPPSYVSLTMIFGSLFLGYTGSPLRKVACNVHSGVQDRNSRVFDTVAIGDIDMLQKLFSDGLARPTDIDHQGTTLIYAAVAYRRKHIANFLLSVGADPHYPNRDRISAFDRAWDGIITCKSIHDHSHHQMREVFNDTRELDTWQLTQIHKVVLGLLSSRSLEEELEFSTQDINTVDSHDRTPLWWAVAVADLKAVGTLLDYGADPNIADCEGTAPLRKATAADSFDIFLLLLNRASLNPGLDLNARGGYSGNTPLLIAIRANNDTKMRWLLEHGVEVDKRDRDGYTPLMLAVFKNLHECARGLLEHGADWTLKDPYGSTIITLTAMYGVRDTYNVLASFGAVKGVDNLKAAKDILLLDGFDPGGKSAFLRLLNTETCERCMLDARAGVSASVSLGCIKFELARTDESAEVFHDAVDTHQVHHTHPDAPECLLDRDLEGEEMVVDEDGRVYVRSLFWPDLWMQQQPGQDLVAQNRVMAKQVDKVIAKAGDMEEQEKQKDG
ncbi:ankyrin [Rhizodiscina lignyota]|uniref:Ankyrin n=1 Tax=Rhizodiscina lignyota TaxID=1504668 RepID=A0A9P4IIL6_9PEZI|nr:ankyrin [Rhizodiscina lignyota]